MLTPIEYYSIRNRCRIEKFVALGKQLGCNTDNARFKDINYGCSYLGSGAFASTYTLLADKSVVVKTFPVRSRDSYPEYLKWCLDRQDSPYVPKFMVKDLEIPKFKPALHEKPIWQKNNRWA